MDNKKVALVVVAMVVVLISTFAPLALAADEAGRSDGGNGDLIAVESVSRSNGGNGDSVTVDTVSWVSSNRKTLRSSIFLPQGYLPDGGLGCISSGGWCGFDLHGCCGNCGCLVGFCYGTGC
uniref:Specific abundant protein-like protein 1 n=1 Tax=Panax quinquefolius TaxID=44588 RepID=A9QW61_PANQU|nr:specific abundant protein-like protein 1 [Panax quinquefolius]